MREIDIGVSFIYMDGNTPQLPNAKRGDFSKEIVRETKDQLDNDLIWWQCGFCNGFVLIDSRRYTREKCQCGAVRSNHHGNANWRKGDEICTYI
jgi:hypothetical protein